MAPLMVWSPTKFWNAVAECAKDIGALVSVVSWLPSVSVYCVPSVTVVAVGRSIVLKNASTSSFGNKLPPNCPDWSNPAGWICVTTVAGCRVCISDSYTSPGSAVPIGWSSWCVTSSWTSSTGGGGVTSSLWMSDTSWLILSTAWMVSAADSPACSYSRGVSPLTNWIPVPAADSTACSYSRVFPRSRAESRFPLLHLWTLYPDSHKISADSWTQPWPPCFLVKVSSALYFYHGRGPQAENSPNVHSILTLFSN